MQKDRESIMPIYKRCSRCGRRLPEGTQCPCRKQRHKEYDRYQRDRKSKQYYSSKEWIRIREEVLDLDEGIDVYLFMTEGKVVAADTVHHIIPLKEGWEQRSNIENLMSLHHDTHSVIEQRYKKEKDFIQKELKKMLLKYRSEKEGRSEKF